MDSEMKRERCRQCEEGIAFKSVDTEKHHTFALMKTNDATYPFYVIKIQKSKYDDTVRRLKRKHPDLKIILQLQYNPNAINLFNRIKEPENIRVYYNGIHFISGCKEEQLVSAITEMTDLKVFGCTEEQLVSAIMEMMDLNVTSMS
ncbi:hypothetical protein AVEN_156287-1 [Araneus ventricosus]|uniref:DUF3627 domain-containing protein n=1 Tax=Araneus ventricosus TaxID=182803 RepID=A0A4Y2UDX9_ARAVE|nr:hypothetical protein AVEN_156287-1 [Araneus ventricosus]